MSERVACRVENLIVPPDRQDTVEDLVYTLFERRHHNIVGGPEQDWLTVELVQSLRKASRLYREELSTKTSGPLPFALGYFKLHDDHLRLTTDTVPANVAPRTLVRMLSEFVEPGGRVWFGEGSDVVGWEVEGYDEIADVSGQTDTTDR